MSARIKTFRFVAVIAILAGSIIFGSTIMHSVVYSSDDTEWDPLGSFSALIGNVDQASSTIKDQLDKSIPESSGKNSYVPNSFPNIGPKSSQLPKKLIIPSLGINAKVEYVGINAKGNMGTPSNFSNVAWYRYGTVPGMNGSAVIDGHVDNGLSLPGVFKRLEDLKSGENIIIERSDQSQVFFVVDEISRYKQDRVPVDQIFNRSDGTYLTLITCTGKWDKVLDMYDERVVVVAKIK